MRLRPWAVAATGLLLAGCGSVHPGAAAQVGSTSISMARADAFALSLCAANQVGSNGQAPAAIPSRQARQSAISVLVRAETARQLGVADHVHPDLSQVSGALSSASSSIEALPADRRDAFRDTLRDYATGQLILRALGRAALERAGRTAVSDTQAAARGSAIADAYAAKVGVEIDPRFGTFQDGDVAGGTGSLSVPQSAGAVAGAASDPSAAWTAALPATQQCS